MKRTKVKSNLERKFLAGLATSKTFLATASPVIDTSLLTTEYSKRIADWCLAYFARYKRAPGKAIESIYHRWTEKEKPDETDVESMSDLLGSISNDYDGHTFNTHHLLDELSDYLNTRKVIRLNEALTSSLAIGNTTEAHTAIQDFRTVNIGQAVGYNPVTDLTSLKHTYAEPDESVLGLSGDAGSFFNPAFVRDALIGVQGPEKRGKTYWLFEFLYRALRKRMRVAMFQVGDLSMRQLNKRFDMRLAELPLYQKQIEQGVRMPHGIRFFKDESGHRRARVKFKDLKIQRTLNEHDARRAHKNFYRSFHVHPDKTHLMFSVHPTMSINVAGINGVLERWKHELDFVPDLILVDYADILAPEKTRKDSREQINETWAELRKLSQVWHACVVAPTQADAASYDVRTQTMKNFSNDKRKLAHVTGMLGLNQTPEEKETALMRLNWIALRESDFSVDRCLWVAQCIPLGVAMVKARL